MINLKALLLLTQLILGITELVLGVKGYLKEALVVYGAVVLIMFVILIL